MKGHGARGSCSRGDGEANTSAGGSVGGGDVGPERGASATNEFPFAKFTLPRFEATNEQHRHAFEDLAECGLVYRAFKLGKRCVRGARSFGSVVIDRDKVKFMAVAKQDPLIAWRNG